MQSDNESDEASTSSIGQSDAISDVVEDEDLINTANYELKDVVKKSNHKIWEYFGSLSKTNRLVSNTKDRIFCKPCFQKKTFKSYANATSVTVLMQHVANAHKIHVTSERIEAKQQKLTDIFVEKKKDNNKPIANDKFVFSRRLVVWLCRDLLPFNVVEKEGFIDFLNSLNRKRTDIPSRTTVSNMALDDMYLCIKRKLISYLKETPDHCSICFDMSSDRYRHISYITYTCHYITNEWRLECRVLKTSMFEGAHSAVRIADDFRKMTAEYGLGNKQITACVDGGADVNCSVRSMGFKKSNCIAHSVNRLIQFDLLEKGQGIDEIKGIIKLLRRIQRTLLFAQGELTELAKGDRQKEIFDFLEEISAIEEAIDADERFDVSGELNKGPQTLGGFKCVAKTRWNCVYKVCVAHFKNSSIIKRCLENRGDYELILSRSQVELLGGIVEMLEVFNTFTKYIQGNSYPTLNSLVLFYVEIKQGLQQIYEDTNCEVIKTAVNILLENLDHRFPLKEECVAAAVLDPTTQHLPIVSTWLRDKDISKEELLHKMVTDFNIKLPSIDTNQPANSPQATPNRPVTLREKLLSRHVPVARQADGSIESELIRFEEIREMYDDAIKFWSKFSDQFPNLSAIAKVLLCIPASTATAESAFSFAGAVVNARRAMIDPFRVEKVLFIHDNYDMLTL